MNRVIKILLFISPLVFVQCGDPEDFFTTVVEADIAPHEPKLATIAHFTNLDSAFQVFVSNSLGVIDTQSYAEIQDADVNLYEEDNLIGNFQYNEESRQYELLNTNQLQAGKDYQLEVSHPDFGMVRSEQQFSQLPKITNVELIEEGAIEFGERVDLIVIEFEDLDENYNYFEIQMRSRQERRRFLGFEDEEFKYDTINAYFLLYSSGEEGITSFGTEGRLLFTNDAFSRKSNKLRLPTYLPEENPSPEFPVEICLSSITADRYFHQISLVRNENASNNPFVEPIILHENIEEGHGIFSLGAKDVWILE